MSSNGPAQNNSSGANNSNNTSSNNNRNTSNNANSDRGKPSGSRRQNDKRPGESSNTSNNARNGQSSSQSYRNRQAKQITLTPQQQEALFEKIAATERVGHCGLNFEGTPKECVICCKVSDLFGVGDCKHPVCMECAIRMRVITDHDTCPQCRGTISLMYFMETPEDDWENITLPTEFADHPDCAAYNIRFQNDYAKRAFDRYLMHSCKLCSKGDDTFTVPTFEALRQHYGQKHRQFFCHICTDNLKLFSWERKTYTSELLQMHMKRGDRDDKSFKGHPSCLFCTDRFFDSEQQYKHLRKDHFFCQICDADGVNNVFYKEMSELSTHYHKNHYPCVIDECKQMGIVFRTELELNVHTASEHGDKKRRVNMDFQFCDRTLGVGYRARQTRQAQMLEEQRNASAPSSSQQSQESQPPRDLTIVSSAEFPAMRPMVIIPSAQDSNRPVTAYATTGNFKVTKNDFPTLGGSQPSNPGPSKPANPLIPSLARLTMASTMKRPSSAPSMPRSVPAVPKVTSSNRRHLEAYDEPSFSGRSSPPPLREAKPKISLIPAERTQRPSGSQLRPQVSLASATHFPSLGGDSAPVAANLNWGKNIKPKPSNAEAAKKKQKELPKPDLWPSLNSPSDGPSGSGGSGGSVTSLKDVSSAFLRSSGQETSSLGNQSDSTSQGEGKKKKKKKNGVTVISLKDLDRLGRS